MTDENIACDSHRCTQLFSTCNICYALTATVSIIYICFTYYNRLTITVNNADGWFISNTDITLENCVVLPATSAVNAKSAFTVLDCK